MNSLNSIQSAYNKIIYNVFVAPIVTVANGGFTSPAVSSGQAQQLGNVTASPYSSSTVITGWNTNINFSSGSGIQFGNINNDPSFVTELSTIYTNALYVNQLNTIGTFTISQNVNISTPGTYQLSFYTMPWSNNYNTSQQISCSFAGQILGAFSLVPNSTWTKFSLSSVISTSGSYPISLSMSNNSSTSSTTVIWLTGVEVNWISA